MQRKKYEIIYDEFKKIGRGTFEAGLNNSHSGNMSVRIGNKILITRRGSMLGFLKDEDIIEVGLYKYDSGIALASTEINVHQAIYKQTSALAVIHTHPLSAIALSIVTEEIIPLDVEGSYFIRKIPILSFEYSAGSKEMEDKIPAILKDYHIAMVKGHGAFAKGNSLEEAFHYSHQLENIAQIICRLKMMGYDTEKLQKDIFKKW